METWLAHALARWSHSQLGVAFIGGGLSAQRLTSDGRKISKRLSDFIDDPHVRV